MFKSLTAIATAAFLLTACGVSPAAPTTTPSSAPTSPPVPSIDPGLPIPDAVYPSGTCAGESSLCTSIDVATWRSIPFTPDVACSSDGAICRVVANFYGPTYPGGWPLYVLVSGADDYATPYGADQYIDDFAKQLAGRGAVVMRANWRRNPAQGAGFPASFADIGCAIGVARTIGADYGAATSHVVLVGHSSGGWAAAIVGLTAAPFDPAAGSCIETTGSLRPDAWAAMAPALSYASALFLGGDQDEKPDAWAAVDPFALAASSTSADRLPVTLIQGGLDSLDTTTATQRFQTALIAAQIDSILVEEPTEDHYHVLEAVESVDALLALAART